MEDRRPESVRSATLIAGIIDQERFLLSVHIIHLLMGQITPFFERNCYFRRLICMDMYSQTFICPAYNKRISLPGKNLPLFFLQEDLQSLQEIFPYSI